MKEKFLLYKTNCKFWPWNLCMTEHIHWTMTRSKIKNCKLAPKHSNQWKNAINGETCSQKNQSCCLSFCHLAPPPPPTSAESGGPLLVPHHLNPCWAGKCAKTHKCANVTNVQTFYPQMCKRPQMYKHFTHKCANVHKCANISPTNVQICKNSSTTKCANVQFSREMCKNIPQMCKSLSSSRISLLQPNWV